MMFNTDNFRICTGRLTADPYIYKNNDGSRKIKLSIAAQDVYRKKDNTKSTQFIPLEAFVSAERTNGVYDMIHQGDCITVQYAVKTNNYKDVAGKNVYGIVLQIENVRLNESKTVTAARQAAKAAVTKTQAA